MTMLLRMRRRHTISRGTRESYKSDSPLEVRPTKLHELCAPSTKQAVSSDATTTTTTTTNSNNESHVVQLHTIQHLTKHDPNSLRTIHEVNGYLPIHLLLQHPHDFKEYKLLEIISWMVTANPEILQDCCGPHRWTPLHVACASRAPKTILQFLVKHSQNALQHHDVQGNLPLHLYVQESLSDANLHADCIDLLVSKCRSALEQTNVLGQTPLHLLLFESRMHKEESKAKLTQIQRELSSRSIRSLVHALLPRESSGPSFLKAADGVNKQLPLHYACKYFGHNPSVIISLVQAFPEALDYEDSQGRLPVHVLLGQITAPALDSVKAVVDLFPESLERPDQDGNLPLQILFSKHYNSGILTTIQYLTLKNSAISKMATINNDKNLPMHVLCQQQNVALCVVQHMLDAYPQAILTCNAHNYTPLWYAKEANVSWKVMKHLYQVVGSVRNKTASTADEEKKDSSDISQ